jgi:hypothetical protein
MVALRATRAHDSRRADDRGGGQTIVWLGMAVSSRSAHRRLRLVFSLAFCALLPNAVAQNSTLPSSPFIVVKEWGNASVNSSSADLLLSLPAHEPKPGGGNPGGAPSFFDDDDKPRKPPYFPSSKGAADALHEAWLQIVLYRQAASLHLFDWFAIDDEYTVLATNDAESWFGKVKSAAYAILSHAFSRCASLSLPLLPPLPPLRHLPHALT